MGKVFHCSKHWSKFYLNHRNDDTLTSASNQENVLPSLEDNNFLWLKANSGFTNTNWANQVSGLNLTDQNTTASQASLESNSLNNLPTIDFDGVDDYYDFSYDINGLDGMSIFMVTKTDGTQTGGTFVTYYSPISWSESGSYSRTYLVPFQNKVDWRFGNASSRLVQSYTRPSIETGYTTTVAIKDGFDEKLRVDGDEVISSPSDRDTISFASSLGSIGRDRWSTYPFDGNIAEIMVLDDNASTAQTTEMEYYLNAKYDLYDSANLPSINLSSTANNNLGSVQFGSNLATVLTASSTELTVIVRAGTGIVDVTVQNLNGQNVTLSDGYDYIPEIVADDLVISEINWAGSSTSASDQWIENYNTTTKEFNLKNLIIDNLGSGADDITLTNTNCSNLTLGPESFFLISRYNYTDSQTLLNITPDCVDATFDLDSSGENLTLIKGSTIVDDIDFN